MQIEGSTTLPDGTKIRRSEYAGWYTKKFATNLIQALDEEFRSHGTYPVDDNLDLDWIDEFADTGEMQAAAETPSDNPAKRRKKEPLEEQRRQRDNQLTEIFQRSTKHPRVRKTIAKLQKHKQDALKGETYNVRMIHRSWWTSFKKPSHPHRHHHPHPHRSHHHRRLQRLWRSSQSVDEDAHLAVETKLRLSVKRSNELQLVGRMWMRSYSPRIFGATSDDV